MRIEKTTGCVVFYDNRDNADNGLSATRTELTLEALWIYGLRGAGNLQDLRDFVSAASRRIRGCKKEGARWGHPLLLFSAAGLVAAEGVII